MESKTHKHLLGKITLFVAVAMLLLVIAMPVNALPPRPPRPPHVTPTAAPTSQVNSSVAIDGGFIRLVVEPLNPALSAVVQWQDGTGKWHSVGGWRSETVTMPTKWWVNPSDFGKGPFRWLVYEHSQKNVVATSDTFFLPESEQHIVDVHMTIK